VIAINLLIALKALAANRLQALLTLCGMSVGIAMVVVVAGLGRGAQSSIEAQLEEAGPTVITIRAGNFVPAAIIPNGEQDSSGGEPGEASESALDVNVRPCADTSRQAGPRNIARRRRRWAWRSERRRPTASRA
jgi:hypothetical protein